MAIRSAILLPYCPLPVNTGGKREMWQCVETLRSLGPCRIISAARKSVGAGWTPEIVVQLRAKGYEVVLREDDYPYPTFKMFLGIVWGAFFKSIGEHRAFGHANPYHRWAFPPKWWKKHASDIDLAVITYSYWAYLPTPCPKALLLLDLWSNTTWTCPERETADIAKCDIVFVISKTEEKHLNNRNIINTHWSPPAVSRCDLPYPPVVGLIGSCSTFNREGLKWLLKSKIKPLSKVRIYGELAKRAKSNIFIPAGSYDDDFQPYRECGIMLMTTVLGMGVQIKSIEALASGRAIIARRGAMRGIPPGDGAWLEVDSPEEMIMTANALLQDTSARETLGMRAHEYYENHLNKTRIQANMVSALMTLATQRDSKQNEAIISLNS
jgi:glycosyltransferase involved in cell wall biosynthesis